MDGERHWGRAVTPCGGMRTVRSIGSGAGETIGGGGAGPWVLCIDDDEDMRDNVLELLDALGWTALGTESGEEGVRLARERRPALVLCDVTLRDLDGYAVLDRLGADPTTADIPLVFVSGHAQPADIARATARGAAGYLIKPVTCAQLRAVVEAHLGRDARRPV